MLVQPILTFLFTGPDDAITMNSVKTEITLMNGVLAVVRSAIRATAELLVLFVVHVHIRLFRTKLKCNGVLCTRYYNRPV